MTFAQTCLIRRRFYPYYFKKLQISPSSSSNFFSILLIWFSSHISTLIVSILSPPVASAPHQSLPEKLLSVRCGPTIEPHIQYGPDKGSIDATTFKLLKRKNSISLFEINHN
ncbi:hypothetical protein Ddye_015537 [Dipteronia dyeriana]|uniref:Uncharacterized protein n=1 Tax=Dipteronia dyeriana TaxID=168575 RepID=A0AAD9WZ90_9ROSI|nr:hypothetical protein Ddye_015537 [Dipteronia dyeriana]